MIASVQGMVAKASPAVHDAFDNLAAATGNAVNVSNEIEKMIVKDARQRAGYCDQARGRTGLNESIAARGTGRRSKAHPTSWPRPYQVDATAAQTQAMSKNSMTPPVGSGSSDRQGAAMQPEATIRMLPRWARGE